MTYKALTKSHFGSSGRLVNKICLGVISQMSHKPLTPYTVKVLKYVSLHLLKISISSGTDVDID